MFDSIARPAVIDVFSGVGGLSLGAARAGFDVAASVELDERASDAHAVNFPGALHLPWDVSKTSGEKLLEALKCAVAPTGLLGGPPCQGFSSIGKRSKEDPRNQLFWHFFRLVSELRPAFYVAENVPGILWPQNEDVRTTALALVPESYVKLEPTVVDSGQLGAPTSRERVFFVGYDPNRVDALTAESLFEAKGFKTITVKEALTGLPNKIRSDWQRPEQGWRRSTLVGSSYFRSRVLGNIPAGVGDEKSIARLAEHKEVSGCLGTKHSEDTRKRFQRVRSGERESISRFPRLDGDGLCPTLRAGTGPERGSFQSVRPIHWKYPRVITPREAARLQGFPDWFQFDETKWHSFRQIGNSVSPLVAEVILSRIFAKLHQQVGSVPLAARP
ncbi:DNA (cytosine-5)-methyltransferase 1 [Panacagrimonas perspica]|uniref:DNA (cytosine-5-)-methyltransferase n=1 Tax=Panacagrimonas perspica TaxID=381431 RepID=A0A4S3K2Z6_9GAMM|nr:DNA cytosine methyltransferase [Panacagrimonas perspica]TDU28863.1 DNA (cytosine-5)-methyltransferase 1 [Panacagrimonas perspica]THD02308.1 hypothetical protein B1810_15390 [Panacagrimonas perspica]